MIYSTPGITSTSTVLLEDGKENQSTQTREENAKSSASVTELSAIFCSPEMFNSFFTGTTKVKDGKYEIVAMNKELHASGVASAVAVVAKAFNKSECVKMGILHYNLEKSPSNFLQSMTSRNVTKVVLGLYGGYTKKGDPIKFVKQSIEEFKKLCGRNIEVIIAEEQINPWNINFGILTENERICDQYGFRLSVGMRKNGIVFITDNTNYRSFSERDFKQFKSIIR